MSKKKIATIWLAGCSGCHMSLLDMDERILDIAKLADIVKSPIVDRKELPEVDIALVEGAVASNEHLEEIKKIREKAKILVSLGDCAVTTNVAALRNWIPKETVLSRSYAEAESNAEKIIPNDDAIQKIIDKAVPLHQVVKVDYYIPGCPPPADLIFYVLNELLNDRVLVLDKEKLKYG